MSDSEFNQTCNTLQNQIDNARDKLQKIQYMDDQAKQKYKLAIERDINAINSTMTTLQQLSMKSAGTDNGGARVRQMRYAIQQLERDAAQVFVISASSRTTFAAPVDPEAAEKQQRHALLAGHKKLLGTGDVIDETNRIGLESEQIGAATMDELRRQREQLEGAEKDMFEIGQGVTEAGSTLARMGRRVFSNKFILSLIIFMLLVGLVCTVYFRWFWRPGAPTPAPTGHPTLHPTAMPTAPPTTAPTPHPTPAPTPLPTPAPTPAPV